MDFAAMTTRWYTDTAMLLAMLAVTSVFLIAEARLVWTTQREAATATAMVFVMVAIASIFFLIADRIMRLVVTFLLGIGG
jgi:preprotein translocase subunit SecE